MDERRINVRKPTNTPVRLYHPELGRLDGITDNISDGGMAIKLNSFREVNIEDSEEAPLFVRPIHSDVLFPVSCLRQSGSKLAVKFLE